MGKVLSSLTRQVKMYNIEARAHKVISRDKPVPAPLHPKTIIEIERMMKENPSALSEQQKKDENLDQNLKKVFVVSHDLRNKAKNALIEDPNRPLPLARKPFFQPDYGYVEPEVDSVPAGKFTLKQAMQFLSDHQSQPQVYTAQAIAKQYKIDQKVSENMLHYYSMFGLHIPKKKGEKETEKKVLDSIENLTMENVPRVLKRKLAKVEEKKEK